MGADSYGTRAAGDFTKVAQIGNSLGIYWEWRQLLDHEGEGYTGAEGRQNEQDSDQRS